MPRAKDDMPDRIHFGTITRPHGRRGEVRVTSHLPGDFVGDEVVLVSPEGERRRAVEGLRDHGETLLLKLSGVDSRREAEKLRECTIEVDREQMPALGENTFYLGDLVGCRVRRTDGENLGRIVGLMDGGGNQILEVERDGSTWMLPVARAIIPEIRLEECLVIVDPPEGLVDLD
ncbi:MAG: ribosome maturation factor RimM [Clostridia bacterium]